MRTCPLSNPAPVTPTLCLPFCLPLSPSLTHTHTHSYLSIRRENGEEATLHAFAVLLFAQRAPFARAGELCRVGWLKWGRGIITRRRFALWFVGFS